MSDGRIRAMSLKEIREALRQGTITRFSLMKPTDDNDGSARRRKSDESGWTPIGYSVFIDTQDEPAYVTKAARAGMAHRNTVATITGIMVFTLVAIGIGVGLYLVKVDLNVEMVAVVSAATVFGTVTSQLWQAGFAFINGAFIGVALAGMTFGMVRWLPEASLFLMKAIVFVLGLLLAHLRQGLGSLGGDRVRLQLPRPASRSGGHRPSSRKEGPSPLRRLPLDVLEVVGTKATAQTIAQCSRVSTSTGLGDVITGQGTLNVTISASNMARRRRTWMPLAQRVWFYPRTPGPCSSPTTPGPPAQRRPTGPRKYAA